MNLREELPNIVTHAVGAVLAFIGLVALVLKSYHYGTTTDVVACGLFGASLVMVYTVSTFYHLVSNPRVKRILRVIDHCTIFIVIAASYVPFALISLGGARGWTIFAVVWGLAFAGILLKIFFTGRFTAASIVTYLAMGWMALLFFRPLALVLPPQGIFWLVTGGVVYSVGILFYVWRSLPYHHAIWHVFVMAGSACHYAAIAYYVIPRG